MGQDDVKEIIEADENDELQSPLQTHGRRKASSPANNNGFPCVQDSMISFDSNGQF